MGKKTGSSRQVTGFHYICKTTQHAAPSYRGQILISAFILCLASCRAHSTSGDFSNKGILSYKGVKTRPINTEIKIGEVSGPLAWSADDKYISVINSFNTTLITYRLSDMAPVGRLEYSNGSSPGQSIFYLGSDQILLGYNRQSPTGMNRTVVSCSTESGKIVKQFATADVQTVLQPLFAYSDIKKYVAVPTLTISKTPAVEGGYRSAEIRLLDALTGKLMQVVEWSDVKHRGVPTAMGFSPNGNKMAVGTSSGKILVFDLLKNGTRSEFILYDSSTSIGALSFSPDGKSIATGRSNLALEVSNMPLSVDIWDAETGRRLNGLPGIVSNGDDAHKKAAPVKSISWSHSTNELAIADGQSIRVWQMSKKLPKLKLSREVLYDSTHTGASDLEFSRNGALAVSVNDKIVILRKD